MNRLKIANIAVIIVFLLLGLALFNLTLLHGRQYRRLSNKNCIRLLPQQGCRGKILDRQGRIIADSKLCYDVMLLPESGAGEIDKSLAAVARILGDSPGDLKNAFRKGYAGESIPVTLATNIELKKAIALEELKADLPGIIITPRPARHYPYGRLASHALGYVSEIDRWRLTRLEDYGYKTKDLVGFGGVEEKYDYYLRQEEGGLSVEVDHRARFVRTLGYRSPVNGKDIQLTLDIKIQKIAQGALSGRKGCVILLDPFSGEVIALASSPDFDPALFAQKSGASIAGLINDRDAPLVNRAISSSFPAGSVFKVIVAAAALETKKINPSTSFLCEGKLLVGRQEFACWSNHGMQNLNAALTHSCNVFFYKAGLLISAGVIHDYARRFGLGKVTGFQLPYETAGFIPSPLWRKLNKFKNWFDGDTANLSIGQGDVLVTPLQMAVAISVFANRGYLINPFIVKAVEGRDISGGREKAAGISLESSTLNYIRQGLRNAVADASGTANALNDLPLAVAGKTGTAQAPGGPAHAWFCGFFPYQEPRFTICVFLERGGAGHNACLVAKEIIGQMAKEELI